MFKLSVLRISLLLNLFTICICTSSMAQEKKIMDESVYSIWNRISDTKISNNGAWILYTQAADQGDKTLKIYNTRKRSTKSFERVDKPIFSSDSKYVYFNIKPAKNLVKELKRQKTKPDEMPKDSLGIYNLSTGTIHKIANTANYKSPEKWTGLIAYTLDPVKPERDTTVAKKPRPKRKSKKSEKSHKLVIHNIQFNSQDTIGNVGEFIFSEEGESLLLAANGNDSTEIGGIFLYKKTEGSLNPIFRSKGKYSNLSFDKMGNQLAFLVDMDTTETKHRPYELYHWNKGVLNKIADRSAGIVDENWDLSSDQKLLFSKDGKRLFFGLKQQEVLQDTTLLEEEIVSVEIWNYKDGKLYTQQEAQADREKKKSYLSVYHIDEKKIFNLGSMEVPDVRLNNEGTSQYAIGSNDKPYHKFISWEGFAYSDLYRINVATGEHKTIANKVNANARVSPSGKYFYWYSSPDSSWFAYNVAEDQLRNITENIPTKFYNELHDSPSLPRSYGSAGWSANEERFFIYDKYDIWSIDPEGTSVAQKITNGRASLFNHKVIVLDYDEKYLPENRWMIRTFNEENKSSSIGMYDLKSNSFINYIDGDFQFGNLIKAKETDDIVYTKQNFKLFPDLQHNNLAFKSEVRASIANPQQKNYKWGSVKLLSWQNLNDVNVEGLLFVPEDFDPKKKYPLIVNFYERSADRLNRHRAPEANRSTINYTFYINNGYIVFNPDIIYEEGYPGKSCYDNVVSGVKELISYGYIDEDNIALQGHSWGGYQIADLLTKTDMFKCAEAGAPVVNMTSAYGGIRWQTGLSRMFQYEKTQSRLGATLWERPDLYLENSPLFNLDKMNTPVLIMHNDADGHVPWYQGIEYFVALRRLGKPAWMLNYNGEPHWPLKWQNRLDFNIRMKQFFDHYLMDAPAPRWMRESIPAAEKGINLGYELEDDPRN